MLVWKVYFSHIFLQKPSTFKCYDMIWQKMIKSKKYCIAIQKMSVEEKLLIDNQSLIKND